MLLPPPISTLFPYTTLFRSVPTRLRHRSIERSGSAVGSLDPHPPVVARGDPGRLLERLRGPIARVPRSEEHTSELQSRGHLVCRLLLEKKNAHQTTPGNDRS